MYLHFLRIYKLYYMKYSSSMFLFKSMLKSSTAVSHSHPNMLVRVIVGFFSIMLDQGHLKPNTFWHFQWALRCLFLRMYNKIMTLQSILSRLWFGLTSVFTMLFWYRYSSTRFTLPQHRSFCLHDGGISVTNSPWNWPAMSPIAWSGRK